MWVKFLGQPGETFFQFESGQLGKEMAWWWCGANLWKSGNLMTSELFSMGRRRRGPLSLNRFYGIGGYEFWQENMQVCIGRSIQRSGFAVNAWLLLKVPANFRCMQGSPRYVDVFLADPGCSPDPSGWSGFFGLYECSYVTIRTSDG